MPLFTVFTPTFNRAHTLHRVFESLQAQTCSDFEWLVIDDGSTDDTPALMARYQSEARFSIRYLREPHRGAHHVHNLALREARGQLSIKLDSDDGCVPEALARLKHHWENIPAARRESFSGVTGLCRDQNGHLVGSRFPSDPLDCSAAELEYRHKVRGEKWGFLRVDVLRQFPYPEDVPGNFIPESYIWCQVSKRFVTRHINEELRIYWTDAPSLPSSSKAPWDWRAAIMVVLPPLMGLGLLVAFNIDVIVPAIERALNVSFLPGSIYLITRMPSDPQSSDILPIAVISLALAFVAALGPGFPASTVTLKRAA